MSKIKIVTHNSSFHTDDVFAVAVLSLVLENDGKEFEVIRTRDQEIIAQADFVVDVGGVHSPDENRFDHHQIGGGGKRENGIPYASFGLVWRKYGVGLCGDKEVSEKIDHNLVQPIDAHDTGIDYFKDNEYKLYPYTIGDVVNTFIPTWKEDQTHDESFLKAVGFAKQIIVREIKIQTDSVISRGILEKSYSESSDKRLMVLNVQCEWKDYMNLFPEVLFIVYPKGDGTWAIKTVRDNKKNYIDRKKLPESWAGKRDYEFEKVTGVPGSVFCHTDCFIAVAKTKEAILKLAQIALEN